MDVGQITVGIIGGSGLYDFEGLDGLREEKVTTPFGEPSAPPIVGTYEGIGVAFIPRHGRGHHYLPSEVNYRANIFALKQLGAERVLSVSAVGSLREAVHPGDAVLVDQLIDKTWRRPSTFFGDGLVGHVSFAHPFCAAQNDVVATAAHAAGFAEANGDRDQISATPPPRLWRGGTYVCMEGPQFSTLAESMLHRSWGADVIGMTAATEAKLAREAELCFSSVAFCTDFDCWHPSEATVTTSAVVAVLQQNVKRAKELLRHTLSRLPKERDCSCVNAAQNVFLTDAKTISPAVKERMRVLWGKYL